MRKGTQIDIQPTSLISPSGVTGTQRSLTTFARNCLIVLSQSRCCCPFLLLLDLTNLSSCNAGGAMIEKSSRVTNEAQLRAQKELEGRTGDTDSEADDDDS